MYSEKLMELFRNPRNMGTIQDADAVGEVGNAACGDLMTMYLKVGPGETIEDVKVQTFGCAAAIATSSILTEMIKGKTFDQALQVSKQDVADELDGLPPMKMHCSLLATDALRAAVKSYRGDADADEGLCLGEDEAVEPLVDPDKCIGCGLCAQLAEDAFEMGPDGKSRVLEAWSATNHKLCDAAASCPVDAITLKAVSEHRGRGPGGEAAGSPARLEVDS